MRRGRLVRRFLILSLVVCLVVFVIWTRAKYSPETVTADAGIPVKVVPARIENLVERIGANSTVEPVSLVSLRASFVRAKVTAVNVDLGDLVQPGQLLAELDRTLYVAALKRAQQDVVRAKTKLDQINQTAGTARERLEASQRSAQAEITRAQAVLDFSKQTVERQTALYKRELIPKLEVDKARSDLDIAQASYAMTREKLVEARANLQDFDINLQANRDTAEFEYAETLEKLTTAQHELDQTRITSPVVGVVTERAVNPGEVVHQTDLLLLTVGRLENVYVVAQVAEEKLSMVSLGQKADIVFDPFPHETVTGSVQKIDPTTALDTRTFRTYIKVHNPDLKYKPGIFAFSRLQYKSQALTIPRAALLENAGEASIFVVEDGRAHLRSVQVQRGPFGKIKVIKGLREGEMVVYYGLGDLKDNDVVDAEQLPTPSTPQADKGA
jgi:HlyD family secretion protein